MGKAIKFQAGTLQPIRGFIADQLKAGNEVPGAELVQRDGLRVK